MLGRQPAAGLHKPGVASWNRESEASRHHGAATVWRQQSILAGEQIEAGVTLPGVRGRRQIGVQQNDGKIEHDDPA